MDTTLSNMPLEPYSQDGGALDEAKRVLADALFQGPRYANDCLRLAKDIGVSEMTIRRAKIAMRIRSRKLPVTGRWIWLPPRKAR